MLLFIGPALRAKTRLRSSEHGCHPVHRNAATFAITKGCAKSHPRRKRAVPRLRCGHDDVRFGLSSGSKVRVADYSEVGIAKQRSPTMKISRARHGRTIKRAKRVECPER